MTPRPAALFLTSLSKPCIPWVAGGLDHNRSSRLMLANSKSMMLLVALSSGGLDLATSESHFSIVGSDKAFQFTGLWVVRHESV